METHLEGAAVGLDQQEDANEEPTVEEPTAGEETAVGEADGVATDSLEASFVARLEESQRLLDRQSDLVDRLHAENQSLRAGELRSAQLPLVRDLLRLHDDVGRMRAAAGEGGDDLRLVQDSLVDTMARNGIELFGPERGEPFDSRLHSAAGVEPTEDETLDRTVAEVMRQGCRWESGDVIRVVEVRAYRHTGTG